jgi:hypothetical protein
MLIIGADGVRLGPAIASLATWAHADVVAIARLAIEALGRRTRETVNLCLIAESMPSASISTCGMRSYALCRPSVRPFTRI